ncbi:peptidoglycan editing factor PgeF [Nitratireductor alexandrii]|uniref:peptidoglycan editing factor PgeF n=1 Tax=Nitratireductor alexandrii TaxID=2448161 RepID=UPI000FD7D379|nr:peptidoglycan editing factor PgeF [Nitratireductor alexandrii]
MLNESRPEPLRSPALDGLEGVRHGFFTRAGGASKGLYRGLNVGLGSQDDRQTVLENRSRVTAWLGVPAANLCTPHQIHSPDIVVADASFGAQRPRADGVVTARPGLAIGILTADCGPVLFADRDAGVIGAAHAGWQGALNGVLEATIAAMVELGARAERIVAVLGPAISQANYEVGPEFVARFALADPANARYFTASARPDHAMFDLNAYTLDRIGMTGAQASQLTRCTYAEEDLFFSYRRTTHRQEADYGRQISAIVLEEK